MCLHFLCLTSGYHIAVICYIVSCCNCTKAWVTEEQFLDISLDIEVSVEFSAVIMKVVLSLSLTTQNFNEHQEQEEPLYYCCFNVFNSHSVVVRH